MAVVAGERRIVTVLFADIVGSTAIGERLGPERTKLLLDEVMRVMSTQVARFEGTVAQYAGDELYAVFGAPVAHEDDSERAVRAGLAIQRTLGAYASEVREAYAVELAVRIAINTGPVVIRPDSEDPYNALGDTLNVASRIQKLVAGGEVVVGRSTKLQVDACFELESLGEQALRGLADPVETFRVLGVRDDSPPSSDAPLVGRDYELSLLERAMDGLVDGRGTIVTIVGEPGIGKTRLLAEVRRRYHDRIRFVEGRAVSYAGALPYWPIRDLLREWLGLGSSTPEARARLELKAELAHLFGDEAEAAYPLLATLLGIELEPESQARLREVSRESLQRETFEFFGELVCRLARESSVCLVLEDLHWADDATLELLEAVLPVTEEGAVGIVLLYRTERDHGSWRLGERARALLPHRYRELELRPLPEDASRALATSVAEGELPDSVTTLLTVRSGGNPFFLEEAFHDLVERGALRREDGRLLLTVETDALTVPTVVQGALQARLDRLAPETREVVGVAAVVGRRFDRPLLERILPYEQVLAGLAELQRLDLVVEQRRRPVAEYAFRHGLVQEVAYASLLEAKRRKLHRRVGDAIEALARESGTRPYGMLARHYTEADEPDKAAEYLLRAGDAARALYADQEALDHYGKARVFLARLGDERRARDTLFKIALAHHLAFDFAGAEDAYDEAFCCKVEPSARLARTATVETAMPFKLGHLYPGEAYTTEGAMLLVHLFRGLLTVDEELNVLPAMADNFRVSSDGATYLFRIRENMRWSDGRSVTADDFAYGWQRMREEDAQTAFLLADVASADALDDRTLEVRLHEPRSYFPYVLASPWALPWPRHAHLEHGDDWRRPERLVCNGPFVLSELGDDRLVLTANPHWAGPHGNVGEVRVELLETPAELSAGWEEGRYDVLLAYDERLASCPDTRAATVSEFGLHYVGFASDREPFSSELVRRAFALALDRARLLAPHTTNRSSGRGGAIPPSLPGHSHRAVAEPDLELARTLLAEAGHPLGAGLPELTLQVPAWFDAAPLVEQWGALGATIRASTLPASETGCRPDGAHVWVTGWTADFPDPDGLFRGLLVEPAQFHVDEEILELAAEARSLKDQAARLRLYARLDRMLVAERASLAPLSYERALLLHRPHVKGLWANPMYGVHLDRIVADPQPARGAAFPALEASG